MGLSIIIITRNRSTMLADALRSLLAQAPKTPYEIIVVDNNSTDDTIQVVREQFPQVRLIALPENLGVGGGRDVGVQQARYEVMFFMDDDALLGSPDAVDQAHQYFVDHADVAILALRIVNHETGTVFSHEFPKIGAARKIDQIQEVAYFLGGGCCIRSSAYHAIGGYCKDAIYGAEEVDLSYRILEKGYRIIYFPAIEIRHRTSPQIRRKTNWFRHEIHSRILLAVRNLPVWSALPYLFLWHLRLFIHAVITQNVKWYLLGSLEGWRESSKAYQQRQVLSLPTAFKVLRLGGRLFY